MLKCDRFEKNDKNFLTDMFFNVSFVCCKKRQYYVRFEKIWTITHYFSLPSYMITNTIKNLAALMFQEMELYCQIIFYFRFFQGF